MGSGEQSGETVAVVGRGVDACVGAGVEVEHEAGDHGDGYAGGEGGEGTAEEGLCVYVSVQDCVEVEG